MCHQSVRASPIFYVYRIPTERVDFTDRVLNLGTVVVSMGTTPFPNILFQDDAAAGENMRSSAREVPGDGVGAAKKDGSNAGLGSMRWRSPSKEALQSAREKLTQMAARLLGAEGSHAQVVASDIIFPCFATDLLLARA